MRSRHERLPDFDRDQLLEDEEVARALHARINVQPAASAPAGGGGDAAPLGADVAMFSPLSAGGAGSGGLSGGVPAPSWRHALGGGGGGGGGARGRAAGDGFSAVATREDAADAAAESEAAGLLLPELQQ